MTFWLKTPNNIYKNWLNSHFDRIMFTVSKLEIKNVAIQVEHPVCTCIDRRDSSGLKIMAKNEQKAKIPKKYIS